MNYSIEIEQETDGRFIAEILELPGVMVYGETKEEAIRLVKVLALRVLADRIENNEIVFQSFCFVAA
jgi:predicted RNase H-like HicB family nuclease